MEKTIVAVLSGFFNQGDGKRPLTEFKEELAALTPAEKRELAEEVVKVTGDTIKN